MLPTVCVCVCVLKGRTTHSLFAGQSTVPYNFYCSQPIHSPVQWTSREKNICVLYQHTSCVFPVNSFLFYNSLLLYLDEIVEKGYQKHTVCHMTFKEASRITDCWLYTGTIKFIFLSEFMNYHRIDCRRQ